MRMSIRGSGTCEVSGPDDTANIGRRFAVFWRPSCEIRISAAPITNSPRCWSAGDAAQAEPFAERARQLSQMEYFLSELKGLNDLGMIRKVVELTEQLGRFWEAAGWCDVALHVQPDSAWAKVARTRSIGSWARKVRSRRPARNRPDT